MIIKDDGRFGVEKERKRKGRKEKRRIQERRKKAGREERRRCAYPY